MALPQPLHIFRKDLTHLWPETLFVLILFIVFAYAAPSAWANSEYLAWITLLSFLLKVLMVISWLVLIARAIQDESLVGDRQFWTSRPYHWASLAAAKAILIFTCIYVPFFLMQVYILHHAGLHPMLVIPALLHNLLLLTVTVIIPLAAISAVTSTFPRVLLTFIATAITVAIIGGFIGYRIFLRMNPDGLWWAVYAIFIIFPAVALAVQYKTRKTLISRSILIATPLLAALVILFTPVNSIIARSYPDATGPTLNGLSDQMPPRPITGEINTFRGFAIVSLPVAVSNVDKDVIYKAEGIQTIITAPGVSYTSPYMSSIAVQDQFSGERAIAPVTFFVPVDIFNKIHDQPVDLQVRMASDPFKIEKPSTWHATLLPFSVPGKGVCSYPSDNNAFGSRLSNGFPMCHYPLQQPDISFVSAQLAAASCSTPAAPPVTGQANVGGGSGATVDFDPVVTVPLRFQTGDPNTQHNYVLCPGTALNFVDAQTLPKAAITFTQKQVVLDAFAARFQPRTAVPPPSQAPEPE